MTGPAVDADLLDTAVALVRRAGELTLGHFRSAALGVERKGDGTPVTIADRDAERFLRDELAARFPGDAVIGEEWPDRAGDSGCTWVIDPIDGTKAFTHGVPLYTNLLARYDEHGCAIGVIGVPGLGEIVAAGRGLGCFLDGVPVRVGTSADLSTACICTSGLSGWDGVVLDAVRGRVELVRTWGDGYGFDLVASGRVEAMVDPQVSVWDIAPMPVIVREAGGRYTDLDGNEAVALDPTATVSAVASNGAVHDALLELLHPA